MNMELFTSHFNYIISFVLMMVGFFAVITHMNLIKKMIGLTIFQSSVLLLYISISKINGAQSPILREGFDHYTNPLPHVLMLTAIVVGVSVLAVGLAIIIRIKETYGTIEEDEIIATMGDGE